MSKNEFLIEKYENLMTDVKMYMSEISKSKVSDLKAQKIIISWTQKHVSAIIEHPVFYLSFTIFFPILLTKLIVSIVVSSFA